MTGCSENSYFLEFEAKISLYSMIFQYLMYNVASGGPELVAGQ